MLGSLFREATPSGDLLAMSVFPISIRFSYLRRELIDAANFVQLKFDHKDAFSKQFP